MKEFNDIKNDIRDSYGKYYEQLNKVSAAKHTEDVLSEEKAKQQITLLENIVGKVKGKKILEIGSGYGLVLIIGNKYFQAEFYGLEPDSEGFNNSYDFSKKIAKLYNVDSKYIIKGNGEKNPFNDDEFDIVYSSNVLEHTQNPQKVIEESIRVLKPNGTLQFIIPNYGSFWEGHYCLFWIPYIPHWFAKIYVRLCGRNPDYIDSLKFINYYNLKKWLRPYVRQNNIEVITLGETIFKERMNNINFSTWAGLTKVKNWIELAHKLKLIKFITNLMIFFKAYTPIILTIRKK